MIERVRDMNEQKTPVTVKAILIDPGSMTVLWMNESASRDLSDRGSDFAPGVAVDQAMPIADMLGVPETLAAVANTGVAQHLRADLVSTASGSVAILTSIYCLPDGKLLVLTENAWRPAHRKKGHRA